MGEYSFCNEISRILQGCSAKSITHGIEEFLGRKQCPQGVAELYCSSFCIDFINDYRSSTEVDHGLRIVSLVIITMMWIGKKDRWNHVCTRFGDGGGAGSTYTCIRGAPCLPHAMKEWTDLCRHAGILPGRFNRFDRCVFPTEVKYLPATEGFGMSQGGHGQGLIERTSSLRSTRGQQHLVIRVQSKSLAAFASRSRCKCCTSDGHSDDFPVPARLEERYGAQDLLSAPGNRSVCLAWNPIEVEQQNGDVLESGCGTDWSCDESTEGDNDVAAFRLEYPPHG